MMDLVQKVTMGASLGLFSLMLSACSNEADNAGAESFEIMVSPDLTMEFNNGPMAEINECIEQNNTELLAPGVGSSLCAWAHSLPFTGLPPGIRGVLAYDWPTATVTVQNNNALILLTEICISIQFDVRHVMQNACGRLMVGPMTAGVATIPIRSELDAIGVDSTYELNMDAFQWNVTSARYIQLLEPVEVE